MTGGISAGYTSPAISAGLVILSRLTSFNHRFASKLDAEAIELVATGRKVIEDLIAEIRKLRSELDAEKKKIETLLAARKIERGETDG